MKIKFGALVTAGSGSIGGHVATKNRSGAVLRTKVTPTNPSTAAQAAVRSLFSSLSQSWRSLTQAQRDAWNAAVTDFSRTDVFGDLRNPSGFNLYQRLNNVLSQVGAFILTVPPTPASVPLVEITSLTAASVTPSLSVGFSPTPVGEHTAIIVRATPAMSAGKSFVSSEYRVIGVLHEVTPTPYDALADYQSIFGTIGNEGQQIFVSFTPVNTTSGQTGVASKASCIIGG
jgi:hypothetical protein